MKKRRSGGQQLMGCQWDYFNSQFSFLCPVDLSLFIFPFRAQWLFFARVACLGYGWPTALLGIAHPKSYLFPIKVSNINLEMAANLAMALDEIIKNQGKGSRAVGVKRGGGRLVGATASARPRFPQRGFVSGVPAGQWKHDKFAEIYGGGKKRASGSSLGVFKSIKSGLGGSIGARIARKATGRDSGGMVKLQMSNLPESVVTLDLEELFQDFNVFGVAVHYDEMGSHLGTADLFTDQQSASNILREFKDIAIDGQEIKFCLVTEGTDSVGAKRANIRDRLQRISGGANPIRKKSLVRKRISGGSIKKLARVGGGRRRVVGGGVSAGKVEAKAKTAEELDKELEAYMKKL
uniref:FoP_duplication domain-containing protein n=1 Tax=Globodera pallida TaxID=36090 RepID=A0A183CCA6_GLOPA